MSVGKLQEVVVLNSDVVSHRVSQASSEVATGVKCADIAGPPFQSQPVLSEQMQIQVSPGSLECFEWSQLLPVSFARNFLITVLAFEKDSLVCLVHIRSGH